MVDALQLLSRDSHASWLPEGIIVRNDKVPNFHWGPGF